MNKAHIVFFLLVLCIVLPLNGQNLTWHRVDGFENYKTSSQVLDFKEGSEGNVYAIIHHDGPTLIYDDNQNDIIGNDEERASVLVKYSAGGEILWRKDLEFLTGRSSFIEVLPDDSFILVGRVSAYTNSSFEGTPIVNSLFQEGVFLAKFDKNGDTVWWNYENTFYRDSRLSNLDDLVITPNGNIYLAGGYMKLQPQTGYLRQDIEFIEIYNSNGSLIERQLFDAGPHINYPTKWFSFRKLMPYGNSVYALSSGNGFYGLSKGYIFDYTQHYYMLEIRPNAQARLLFGVKDTEDAIGDFVIHNDGTLQLKVSSNDGLLNLTTGDVDLPESESGQLLITLDGLNVKESVEIPLTGEVRLASFNEDDERIAFYGTLNSSGSFSDGSGFSTKINVPSNTSKTFISFFTKDLKLVYLDTYDLGAEPGRLYLSNISASSQCDVFYVGGYSYDDLDYDLSEESEVPSPNNEYYSHYLLTKYNNEKPSVQSEDVLEFCAGDEAKLLLEIKDEASDLVQVELTDPTNTIDTDLIGIEGNTIFRQLDFSNVEIPEGGLFLKVRVTDSCGDFSEKEIFIEAVSVPQTPQLDSSGIIYLCQGEEFVLSSIDGEDMTWSDGSTSSELHITEPGDYYGYRTNELGCSSSNSEVVTVVRASQPEVPQITVGGDLEFCEGGEVTLTSDLTENIVWSTGETTQSITVRDSGDYFVYQISEHCGASIDSDVISVTVNEIPDQPTIQVIGDERFCEGSSVQLTAEGSGNVLWSNGSTESTLEITESGEFWYTIERDDCISQASTPINIIVDKDFQFNVVSDTTVCEGVERLELAPEVSGGPVDYLWSDGSRSSTLVVDEAGSYWLEVSNGTCEKPRVLIEVSEACYPKVYIPTAFSPNADGVNDAFQITGIRVVNFELSIFNAWGNQVFRSISMDNSWDGTYNGELLSPGKYSFKLVYGGELNGQPIQFVKSGVVNLIR